MLPAHNKHGVDDIDLKVDKVTVEALVVKLEDYLDKERPERYMSKTVLLDILYFVGLSIDEKKFYAAQGFDEFKKVLREVLKER